MILQALCDLAAREGLTGDPDYEYKPVAWIVRLRLDGGLMGIEGTHQEVPSGRSRKPKLAPRKMLVPRQSGRSGTKAPAYFLVDNAKYVFGRQTRDGTVDPAEGGVKAADFLEQVDACARETGDEAARAVAAFLERIHRGAEVPALPAEARSNDQFAFALGTEPRLVHERPAVRSYWASIRSRAGSGNAPELRCLVTGQPVGEPGLVDKVKGVPGCNPSGGSVVSFNRRAFESYGWEGNRNAPIARTAAEAASTALNRLLASSYPDPRHPEQQLGVRNVRVSGDTVVVFWGASAASDLPLDTLAAIIGGMEPDPASVGDLYHSIRSGRQPPVTDAAAFYALTLSGAQGRVIIRGWIESTVEAVMRNVSRHFADLANVRSARGRGGAELPPPSLRTMLDALAPPGAGTEVPAALGANLVQAALAGTPYPLGLCQRALLRERAEAGNHEWVDMLRRDSRAALIKAVLIRRFGRKVQPTMDRSNFSPGYRLGRIMAVIERMQQAALGDVNATVVDRYYSGASATPAVVFPRLLKNMRNHARKAKDDERGAGTARWLEAEADEILSGVAGFPPYLTLEQQGLFVLGYHQERHWLWSPKDQRTKGPKAESDTNEA